MLDPIELEEAAAKTSGLRHRLTFDIVEDGSDIYAQEFYMLALAALDQAERYFRLASYNQARSNAGGK